MTGFLDIQFPTNISLGATGGPQFLTRIVSTQAGFEYRTQAWGRARGLWNVGSGLKEPQDWADLIAFFYITQGRTFGFRFKDWSDFKDDGRGTLEVNANGDLQLCKTYFFGTATPVRRFLDKPVEGTIVGVSVDSTTGLALGGAEGAPWTGEFDVPVRFDTDHLDLSIDHVDLAEWHNIPVIEIRV